MNKAQKVLTYIKESGDEGRSYGDIQRFVCEMNGLDYDAREDLILLATSRGTSWRQLYGHDRPMPEPKPFYFEDKKGFGRVWQASGQSCRRIEDGYLIEYSFPPDYHRREYGVQPPMEVSRKEAGCILDRKLGKRLHRGVWATNLNRLLPKWCIRTGTRHCKNSRYFFTGEIPLHPYSSK